MGQCQDVSILYTHMGFYPSIQNSSTALFQSFNIIATLWTFYFEQEMTGHFTPVKLKIAGVLCIQLNRTAINLNQYLDFHFKVHWNEMF